ncbi:Thromboxane-A synthase [Orchesella cincta]|uniref:Thromboxane-A synthase n=1 Tax=Orchesella cincta TaxID=48709 RepID=A0A1D2ND25_ORCCI|nr:Thromboxane-A synthase [Orchesella cincta]
MQFGPICGYYMGAKPVILLAEPSLIHSIQVHPDFLDRPRRVPGGINPDPNRAKMLGNLGVSEWKDLRGILDKAFSPKKLKAIQQNVQELINTFMSKLALAEPADSVNFYPLYQNLTLDLIGKTGFGIDSDIQTNPNDALKRAVDQEFSKATGTSLLKFFLCFPEFHGVLQPIRVVWEKVKIRLGIAGHSELWKLGRKAVLERQINPQPDATDLLQVMLDSGKLDETSIVANSVLFFEAGFETLSAGLAFITYLMVKHPEAQEKVRAEIGDLIEKNGAKLDCYKLKQLKFLDQCINEALRMYPPQTTFIGRSGSTDIFHEYELNGKQMKCVIPANVHIQVGLNQILNSDAIWESPRSFIPERHAGGAQNEETKHDQKSLFNPLEVGDECASVNMTLKMMLVSLFISYRLVPSDETEDDIAVIYKTATMTPKNGVFGKLIFDPIS